MYMEGLSSGFAADGVTCLNVGAGEAAFVATAAASLGCLKEGWLQLCTAQESPCFLVKTLCVTVVITTMTVSDYLPATTTSRVDNTGEQPILR